MTGTVVKANRKEIGIWILWDGDASPVRSRHDEVVDPRPDATDMLDGRGVLVGDRVELVQTTNGPRPRFTGDAFHAEPDPAPTVDKGIETREQFEEHVKILKPVDQAEARFLVNHLPSDDDAGTEYGF